MYILDRIYYIPIANLDKFSRFGLPYFSIATFTSADTRLLVKGNSCDGISMFQYT